MGCRPSREPAYFRSMHNVEEMCPVDARKGWNAKQPSGLNLAEVFFTQEPRQLSGDTGRAQVPARRWGCSPGLGSCEDRHAGVADRTALALLDSSGDSGHSGDRNTPQGPRRLLLVAKLPVIPMSASSQHPQETTDGEPRLQP